MLASHWVLVIDDDPDIRETLRDLLEDEGYRVSIAANGREALDILHRSEQKPCLILLDLMMPVMDGWKFREEQQQDPQLSHIPVAVVTAAGDRAAASITADEVLRKPLSISELMAVVEQHC